MNNSPPGYPKSTYKGYAHAQEDGRFKVYCNALNRSIINIFFQNSLGLYCKKKIHNTFYGNDGLYVPKLNPKVATREPFPGFMFACAGVEQ